MLDLAGESIAKSKLAVAISSEKAPLATTAALNLSASLVPGLPFCCSALLTFKFTRRKPRTGNQINAA